MKQIFSYFGLLLIALFCVSATDTLAQDLPYLNSFSLSEINGKVYLQWIIASGNTCDGVYVYRSADGENFEEIGKIGGICGSPYSAVSYDYWDSLPLLNTTSYYRLELGNLGFSDILAVQLFDFSKNPYQIIPHPATAETVIYFDNPSLELFTLQIFYQNGQQLYEAQTASREFKLKQAQLDAGLYVFVIRNSKGTTSIKGKLIAR